MSEQEYQPANGSQIRFERSETIGKLTDALTKASSEFDEVKKTTENPYFRSHYADLAALIGATRKALSKHGLAIVQLPQVSENRASVTTLLTHISNEWISTVLALPATKQDAQGLGSAITYARRYAYQSILNIAGEEDDDGNAAVGKTQSERGAKSTDEGEGLINPVQLRAFNSSCKQGGRTESQVADYLRLLGLNNIEQLPKAEFTKAINWALNKKEANLEGELRRSVDAKQKRNGRSLEVTNDDSPVFTMCATHGKYSGEGNCPKCEAV